jgi:hypothetical protein
MTFEARIAGDPSELRLLASSLRGDTTVVEVNGEFLLQSARLDACADARAALVVAQLICHELTGVVTALLGSAKAIESDVIYTPTIHGRDVHVQLKPGKIVLRGFPATLRVTHADGTVEERGPVASSTKWLEKAATDGATSKILRLLGNGHLGWVELYRLLEALEDAAGHSATAQWSSAKDIRRFKHTANSVAAAGDEARHGKERTDPPKEPMSLGEARALVIDLVKRWLSS